MTRDEATMIIEAAFGLPGDDAAPEHHQGAAVATLAQTIEEMGMDALTDAALERLAEKQSELLAAWMRTGLK